MPEWPWFLSLYIVLSLAIATGLWLDCWFPSGGRA